MTAGAAMLDNQIGYADETTYGTRVAPTRFLDLVSEGVQRQQNNRASAGLRKGQKVQRQDKQNQANRGANGAVSHDLAFTGFGLLLKHCFGKAPVITQPNAGSDPTVYDQTFTLGDGAGLSLTTQVGRPGTAGVVKPFDYLGCKVADWTISQGIDAFANLGLTLDAQNEQDNQTLATPSYPAAQALLEDGILTVSVNSTTFYSRDSSIKCDRGLKLDRFFQQASTLKKEPIKTAFDAISGDLSGEFEDLTTFDLFKAGTIVPITFTWVGAVISHAYTFTLTVTLPACRLDGPKPVTSGPGVLDAPTPFTVLYDGTNEPITVAYRTTDAAI